MAFDYATLIGSLGFPIVICLWFMIRTEKVISANTQALIGVKEVIVLCKRR